MTVLLPRLDREQTSALIDEARPLSIQEITDRMPERNVITTSSELGGLEIDDDDLVQLRDAVVELARGHGFPGLASAISTFEGHCARLLYDRLDISPHEAAEERGWSSLTVCWLMDIAVWRWAGIGDDRRFRGDVNRNTFRRLWWRAEVLGPDIDLTQLGEDEFVSIMERPTIAANRRLTRMLATAFLEIVEAGAQRDRMMLMRDAGKHIVRLTPIVDLHALTDSELRALIDAVLDAAAGGVPLAAPSVDVTRQVPAPSEGVEQLSDLAAVDIVAADLGSGDELQPDVAELAHIAIGIARRAGRVTTVTLCEALPLDMTNARRLLQGLADRGELIRRGRTRGTYYIIPDSDGASDVEQADADPDGLDVEDSDVIEVIIQPQVPAPLDSDAVVSNRAEGTESDSVTSSPSPPSRPRPSWPPAKPPPGPWSDAAPHAARDALRRLLRRK